MHSELGLHINKDENHNVRVPDFDNFACVRVTINGIEFVVYGADRSTEDDRVRRLNDLDSLLKLFGPVVDLLREARGRQVALVPDSARVELEEIVQELQPVESF